MATTITFPADAVNNGATEIQATVFALVAADYAPLSWGQAQNVMRAIPYKVPNFPKTATEDPNWMFFVRKDLASASAPSRNLIGISVVDSRQALNAFSGALGTQISIPLNCKVIMVYNWVVHIVTLSDGTSVQVVRPYVAGVPILVDPETGNLLDDADTYNALLETIGFMFTQVAASSPSRARLYALVSGINPLS